LLYRDLTIWYDKILIANVLSFSQVKQTCDVEMIGEKFVVTWKNGTKWDFKHLSEFGFNYSDTDWSKNKHCNKHVLLASTVEDNKSKFTLRDVSKANKARNLEAILSFPTTRQYKWAVESNVILNCPVRSHDIEIASKMYGPHTAALAGKTTRRPSKEVLLPSTPPFSSIDPKYRRICICVDVLTVDGLKFITTIIPTIKHSTITAIEATKSTNIWAAMKPTINRYKRAGFTVDEDRGDGEFEAARPVIEAFGINLRVCANNEHEPYVERHHRILQERMRGLLANSAFNKLPKVLTRALAKLSTFYLNHLPWNLGVSKTLSPAYIMSGQRLDYKNHCQLEFLEYVHVHNPSDNTIKPRTSPALNLGPTARIDSITWHRDELFTDCIGHVYRCLRVLKKQYINWQRRKR